MRERNTILSLSLAAALSALVVGVFANTASANEADRVTARIPFAFTAGEEVYPAGDYTFLANDPVNPHVVTIESSNGRKTGLALTESSGSTAIPVAASEVVFDRFGDRYFLSKVLVSGNDAALEIPKSEIQMEMERNGQRSNSVRVPATKGKN